MSRITELEAILDAGPEDPFIIYALALEYEKLSNTFQAMLMYEHLINDYPNYIATYYQYSKLLYEAGNRTQALLLLRQGIEWGTKENEMHAVGEMKALLAQWTDDEEED
jgi:tetratricopeptide (TPR) repeat protein